VQQEVGAEYGAQRDLPDMLGGCLSLVPHPQVAELLRD